MTLDQCIKSILDKQSQIKQIEEEVWKRKQQLKELTPYKVGDLVRVVGNNKKEIICYISDVEWYWNKPHYTYKFTKPKKDGTMGQQSAGIYHYDKVELIKKAGE